MSNCGLDLDTHNPISFYNLARCMVYDAIKVYWSRRVGSMTIRGGRGLGMTLGYDAYAVIRWAQIFNQAYISCQVPGIYYFRV